MVRIDRLARSRRRTLGLEILPDGRLLVRAPMRADREFIEQVVRDKQAWILKRQLIAQHRQKEATPKTFTTGEEFRYLGNNHRLELSQDTATALTFDGTFKLAAECRPRGRELFTVWYRAQAARVIQERVDLCGARSGLAGGRVRITNARQRWGSCSARGKLCFSWRLVMAPLFVIDYVSAHELAHLQHHGHNREFWNLVRTLEPEYRTAKLWLKQHGHRLDLKA